MKIKKGKGSVQQVIQNFSKKSGEISWHPKIEEHIKKTFDVIVNRNVFSIDYIVMEIISELKEWKKDSFDEYYTYAQKIKTHLSNMVLFLTSKNADRIYNEIKVKSIGFMKQNIIVSKIDKNIEINYFKMENSQKANSWDFFGVDTNEDKKFEDFILKFKNKIEDKIKEESFVNFDDYFIVGKYMGELFVFNTKEGLAKIIEYSLIELKTSDIPTFYLNRIEL